MLLFGSKTSCYLKKKQENSIVSMHTVIFKLINVYLFREFLMTACETSYFHMYNNSFGNENIVLMECVERK